MYQDGAGGVYVSDDGKAWRGAQGKFDHGMVTDFFPLPPVCTGCAVGDEDGSTTAVHVPTHVHEWVRRFDVLHFVPLGGVRNFFWGGY